MYLARQKQTRRSRNLVVTSGRGEWGGTNYGMGFSSFQSLSHVQLFVTPWTAGSQPSLSITNSRTKIPKLIPNSCPSSQSHHPTVSSSVIPFHYCGQESLRRNGVAIVVNRRVWNAVLGCNLRNERMISVHFQGKPFNISNPSLCPDQ